MTNFFNQPPPPIPIASPSPFYLQQP